VEHTLDALVDRYIETTVEDDPVHATYLGIHDHDGEFAAYDAGAIAERRDHSAALLRDLEGLPAEGLTPDEQIDRAALASRLRTDLFEHDELGVYQRDPTVYLMTALSGCHMLIARDFAPVEDRARSFASRLERVADVLTSMRRNLIRPPTVFAESGAEMAAAGAAFVKTVTPRLADAAPPIRPVLERGMAAAGEAFESAAEYLRERVHDRARPFEIGRERYDWLLRESHLLAFGSDELRAMGVAAVRDTRARMKELAAEIGPDKDWLEILEDLKADHPTREGLREFYASSMERARDFTVEQDLVTVPAGEQIEVIDTPAFLRGIIPYAAYLPPGPFEKDQRGLFYVTPVDESLSEDDQERQLRGHSVHAIPVVALHEGYPGHHLQLVRANASPRKVRRVLWNNVFCEGWALYCEEMMRERGFYSDVRTRLGQLKETLWRAARVIVDVDLQRGDMTYEEAIDFMVEEVRLERVNATAEVKRYTAHPTQPSSYMIGKRAILAIRKAFEAREGAAFDLKRFHDSLLDLGSIQPSLVRTALGLGGEGRA